MSLEEQIAERMERGDFKAAATISLQGLGPQVLGYLTAVLRDEDDARDVFSQFAEDLWKGLPGFRGECSFRAWAFRLAWHAAARFARDPYRKRGRPIRTTEISRIAASVRSLPSFRPGGRAERLLRLRETLEPEEQTLLILRLDKELPWEEVAHVLSQGGAPVAPAALRKRFERLKEKLGKMAKDEGLLD
jgi:RNA polymerase sigma-70 factor (ECF subfamily)